jgi:GNAT superfamily N-acetyltransferase
LFDLQLRLRRFDAQMQYLAEDIERASLEEFHSIAPAAVRESVGLDGRTIGSAFVSIASALPSSAIVVNRAIGVGLGKPETKNTINEIVDAYQSADVDRYFVQLHPDTEPAAIEAWLLERGVEKARGWQKFSRGREAVPAPATDLTIKEIRAESGSDLAGVLSDAFDLGDAARPWISLLPTCSRWHVFMTYDGDIPAGTGSVFIDGECAWMDFGATAPQFRQRGSQTSLLRHRVQFALEQGCRRMFTCTGEAVPGDPQHSYTNIMKAGFKEDYVRANYAPPRLEEQM